MSGAAVRVAGLRVRRGGREVLDVEELAVEPRTVTGLLGPSGSGKTTLLRSIVGVQRIAAGEVAVLGAPAGTATLRRRVGYMTQSASVYPDLTVRENLRFFARVLGTGDARIGAVLDDVDMRARAGQPARSLSGGERNRLSLAVALLGEPELLVLDEPTVGLDPRLRVDLWDLFARLAAAGATLLVSSHSMDEAKRCDRLLLLRAGRLLASGSPQEIRERTQRDDLEEAFLALVDAAEARS